MTPTSQFQLQFLANQVAVQLSANISAEDYVDTLAPVSHVGSQDRVPGSGFALVPP